MRSAICALYSAKPDCACSHPRFSDNRRPSRQQALSSNLRAMADMYHFGMVGLGTMGRNLALNIADHGYSVLGLATSEEKAKRFAELAEERPLSGSGSPEHFIAHLEKPRIVMTL